MNSSQIADRANAILAKVHKKHVEKWGGSDPAPRLSIGEVESVLEAIGWIDQEDNPDTYRIAVVAGSSGADLRMTLEREDGGPVTCNWDTLQALKNYYLGWDACAVEVFPPKYELVDEVNRRHLWLVDPSKVPSLVRRDNPCI